MSQLIADLVRRFEFKEKLYVSVWDHMTPEQREDVKAGTTALDVSDAWQAAFDEVAPYGRIDLWRGKQRLDTGATMTGKAGVRLRGDGVQVFEPAPTNAALLNFEDCDGLNMADIDFQGSEDQTYWTANTPATRRRFVRVANSARPRLRNITGRAKRGHIILDNCVSGIVSESDFSGFLTTPVSSSITPNANECTSVEFSGGRHNKALYCHAENHGSVVLCGMDGVGNLEIGCTGRNLHDNGIYNSSGTQNIAALNTFDEVYGSGVKSRGSQNIVAANSARNVKSGSVFSVTGNGVPATVTTANGTANICALNSGKDYASDGLNCGAQDGGYQKNFVVAFNAFDGATGAGGFAGIRGTILSGGVVAGNAFGQSSTNYQISLSGLTVAKTNATTTAGSAVVTFSGGTTTDQLEAGQVLTGAGVPVGTTVQSVDSSTQITMTANATASAAVTLTFVRVIQEALAVFGNTSVSGAQLAMLQHVRKSVIAINPESNTPQGIEGRVMLDSVIVANVNPAGSSVVNLSAANNNKGNLVIGNRGASSIDAELNAGAQNWPAATLPNPATQKPNFVGQQTVISGNAHIATGTASTADWKQAT